MGKTNYSVARIVTYTKQNIGKAERHNERKNKIYSNVNVDLSQTTNNIHYKTCNTTYNQRLQELVDTKKVSLRGLKDNAKVFDELILDINSNYFEIHGGYEFAKKFYEKAYHFAENDIEETKRQINLSQQELNKIQEDVNDYKNYKGDIDNIDVGKSKLFGKKVELDTNDYKNIVKYAKKGIIADVEIEKLKDENKKL
ncbi:MAG: plasmid recombination protein, partial [Clostridia bacterium]|nr:plasmid recombination protein [Clostridia bacterium]